MNKLTISDIITEQEISKWNDGDVISISAPTGAGKSHFIKHSLTAKAHENDEKVLMLLHRNRCISQFKREIEKFKYKSAIDIRTYQSIEEIKSNKNVFNFNPYKYIVIDEMHYFLDDSPFNRRTYLSLNAILEQKGITRIFMSATGGDMNEFLEKPTNGIKPIKYTFERDFNHIQNVSVYTNDEYVNDIVKDVLRRGEKMILFFNSAEKAYKYYKKHKDVAIFNCGESNSKHAKHIDEYEMDYLLENKCLDDGISLIFTTMTLDAGLNIEELEFKNVLYDGKLSMSQMIQCMGRIRILNDDHKINVYIKNHNNNQIGHNEAIFNVKYEYGLDFLKYKRDNDIIGFVEKYMFDADDYGKLVHDDVVDGQLTKSLNEVAFFKIRKDLKVIEEIKKVGSFIDYLKKFFERDDIFFYNASSVVGTTVTEYLSYIDGIELYKENQDELKRILELNNYKWRTFGINTVSRILKDGKFGYTIKSRKDRRRKINGKPNPQYNKMYWMIEKK